MIIRKDHTQIIEQIKSNKENNRFYQNNPLYFDQLLKLVDEWPGSYIRKLRAIGRKREVKKNAPYEHLKMWIEDITDFALRDSFYTLATKVTWILHGLTDFPKCLTCGTNEKFKMKNVNPFSAYGNQHCSIKCGENDNNTKKKIKTSKLIKYGDENFSNPNKTKQTIQRRIEENPSFWDNRNAKAKSTWLQKYGVDHPMKSDDFKSRLKENCLKTRGVEWPIQDVAVKDNIKKTNNAKYGVDWVTQSNEFKTKCIDFYQKNYGVNGPSQVKSIQEKQRAKYNYDNLYFDSAPEVALYIWLKDHNVDFIFQPDVSFEYECNGKKHMYFPDFKIGERYVELKGDQFIAEDGRWQNPYDHSQDDLYEAKHQCAVRHDVCILTSEYYVKFIDYIVESRGKDFLHSCKCV